jgi:hypothetical protein
VKGQRPPKEPGTKKARTTSAEEAATAHQAPTPVASPDISGSQVHGKSRFYTEYIRLSDNLACGQLFFLRELRLSSCPEDYGDMRVYSGSSSSGEMNSAKEETYRLLKLLGHRQRGLPHSWLASGSGRG